MPSTSPTRTHRGKPEQGYVLLALLLVMAVMGIVAATLVTDIKFEIQRDREEEMIHRGVQYSRAIRAYYKKFGRYPATLENLENTNQMRFLRKRYKDPLTGKDFKLLHFGEVKMGMMGMTGGGVIPGASTLGPNGNLTANNGSSSGLGGSTYGGSNSFGQSSQTQQQTGANSGQGSDTGADSQNSASNGTSDSGDQSSSDKPAQTFGGLPIVGVASTSKQATIREFDKKKKYNEWSFVYDPSLDRGLLITTPYQPQLQMFGTGPQNVNGAVPTPTPGLGAGAPGTTAPPPSGNSNFGNPNQLTDTPAQQ